MKKVFITLFFFAFISNAAGQIKQQQKVDSVVTLLLKYWKEKNADEMYKLGGANFRKQYTPESFKEVWNDQMFKLGDINEKSIIKSNAGINKYKLVFEPITFSFTASLDTLDKFDIFNFALYKDETAGRKTKIASDNKLNTLLDKQVDTIMQQYFFDTATVGASIGILVNGKSYLYNYGETVKGNRQLLTNKSIYEIGSISKTFTASLLALAVLEGKVKLSDPVNKYLPKDIPPLQFNNKPITLQSLSNHTSGLPYMPTNLNNTDSFNLFKDYDNKALFDLLKTFKLTREAGEQYEYSNVAVGLLGVILERVYNKTYEQLVADKITRPLIMPFTSQNLKQQYTNLYAKGHDGNGNTKPGWDFKSIAAAGALHSNVSDLLKYATANIFYTNQTLQKAFTLTHKTTFKNATQEVGLGWHKVSLDSVKVILHTGGTGGFKSCIAIIPEKKLAVVGLSNQLTDVQKEMLAILEKLLTENAK